MTDLHGEGVYQYAPHEPPWEQPLPMQIVYFADGPAAGITQLVPAWQDRIGIFRPGEAYAYGVYHRTDQFSGGNHPAWVWTEGTYEP